MFDNRHKPTNNALISSQSPQRFSIAYSAPRKSALWNFTLSRVQLQKPRIVSHGPDSSLVRRKDSASSIILGLLVSTPGATPATCSFHSGGIARGNFNSAPGRENFVR